MMGKADPMTRITAEWVAAASAEVKTFLTGVSGVKEVYPILADEEGILSIFAVATSPNVTSAAIKTKLEGSTYKIGEKLKVNSDSGIADIYLFKDIILLSADLLYRKGVSTVDEEASAIIQELRTQCNMTEANIMVDKNASDTNVALNLLIATSLVDDDFLSISSCVAKGLTSVLGQRLQDSLVNGTFAALPRTSNTVDAALLEEKITQEITNLMSNPDTAENQKILETAATSFDGFLESTELLLGEETLKEVGISLTLTDSTNGEAESSTTETTTGTSGASSGNEDTTSTSDVTEGVGSSNPVATNSSDSTSTSDGTTMSTETDTAGETTTSSGTNTSNDSDTNTITSTSTSGGAGTANGTDTVTESAGTGTSTNSSSPSGGTNEAGSNSTVVNQQRRVNLTVRYTHVDFTDDLKDNSTQGYKDLVSDIEEKLSRALTKQLASFMSVKVLRLSPGSVIAEHEVTVENYEGTDLEQSVESSLLDAVEQDDVEDMRIDETSIKVQEIQRTTSGGSASGTTSVSTERYDGYVILYQFTREDSDISNVKKFLTEDSTMINQVITELQKHLNADDQAKLVLEPITFLRLVRITSTSARADFIARCESSFNPMELEEGMRKFLDVDDIFGITIKSYTVTKHRRPTLHRWTYATLKLNERLFINDMRTRESFFFTSIRNDFMVKVLPALKEEVSSVQDIRLRELRYGSAVADVEILTDTTSTATTDTRVGLGLGNLVIPDFPLTVLQYSDASYVYVPIDTSGLEKDTDSSRGDEDDASFKEDDISKYYKEKNYFFNVTIPSFAALICVILIFLCCTAGPKSPLFSICSQPSTSMK